MFEMFVILDFRLFGIFSFTLIWFLAFSIFLVSNIFLLFNCWVFLTLSALTGLCDLSSSMFEMFVILDFRLFGIFSFTLIWFLAFSIFLVSNIFLSYDLLDGCCLGSLSSSNMFCCGSVVGCGCLCSNSFPLSSSFILCFLLFSCKAVVRFRFFLSSVVASIHDSIRSDIGTILLGFRTLPIVIDNSCSAITKGWLTLLGICGCTFLGQCGFPCIVPRPVLAGRGVRRFAMCSLDFLLDMIRSICLLPVCCHISMHLGIVRFG